MSKQCHKEASTSDVWKCKECFAIGPSTEAIKHTPSCDPVGRWYSQTTKGTSPQQRPEPPMARVIAACRRVVDLTKQNKWHRDADEELMAAIAELEAGAPARTETPEVKS